MSYFARSFQAMLRELAKELELPEERLRKEFKAVHQRYGNSEQPFAVLELPAVRERLPGRSRYELLQALEKSLAAFKEERKPNPELLRDICAREGVDKSNCWYAGDSLTLDISMAKQAGVQAVWVRYGTEFPRRHWKILVDSNVRPRKSYFSTISNSVRDSAVWFPEGAEAWATNS